MAPPAGADFSAFHPDFTRYRAVVLNCDAPDERWPAGLKQSFEDHVTNGGGLGIVHAADGSAVWERQDFPHYSGA